MTKQDRAEKKRVFDEERRREKAEFPEARFDFEPLRGSTFSQICIEEDSVWITLRRTKSSQWEEEDSFPNCEYVSTRLDLNISGLAALIRALVLRYNAIVKCTNSLAEKTPRMEPFEIMDITESSAHP